MTTKTGRRLPVMDSLLAATVLAHDLKLATRNLPDFKAAGVTLVDPWAGSRRESSLSRRDSSD